jgi:hypothetical protein
MPVGVNQTIGDNVMRIFSLFKERFDRQEMELVREEQSEKVVMSYPLRPKMRKGFH